MKAEDIHRARRIYMIGIGGIGMSALARYFMRQGKSVAGYDRVSTPLTDDLIREGSDIHFTIDLQHIRDKFPDPGDLLVIYTPAIPEDHAELRFFRKGGYHVIKRAQALGILAAEKKCIAVAGTHGKTTVSSMLAHLLQTAGIPCNAFLGGISKNYRTNAVFSDGEGWMVLEADEFDRSFLNLYPDIAVITSCDPDHLDVYGSEPEMRKAYCRFIRQIRDGGTLICRTRLELDCMEDAGLEIRTYTVEGNADYSAKNLRYDKGVYCFDADTPDGVLESVRLGVPGKINIENALAVIVLSRCLGVDDKVLKASLSSFAGVARRFDVHIMREDFVYMDDYAHHPGELDACIDSVRDMYPGRKITGIFQPHLFSRTKDLAEDFARSLEKLDELILLDIYPAREKPIKGITSRILFDWVRMDHKILVEKARLMTVLAERTPEILLTLGAGDIDQFVEPITNLYGKMEIP